MGLNDLSKADVENVFSYVLSKFDTVDAFLDNFESLLKKLYEHQNYEGGWDQSRFNKILDEYSKKTDAIKKDYKDKKIVHLTSSSMTIAGGVLSFTFLAPIGWGLLGAGSAMGAITNVVELADKSKQKAWEKAKNNLQAYVNNPFEGTDFKNIYDCLIMAISSLKDKISNDDCSIIIQGLGWNYFLFRSDKKNHEEAIQMLKTTLELFKTKRYIISSALKAGDEDAIKEIQMEIKANNLPLVTAAGALGFIGFSAGLSIGLVVSGINIANVAFRGAETIAQTLLHIGNFALKHFNILMKFGAGIAIVGGVISIIFDARAIHNIDKAFEPYYNYKIDCINLIKEYKVEYDKTNTEICEMYKFMKENKSEKEV